MINFEYLEEYFHDKCISHKVIGIRRNVKKFASLKNIEINSLYFFSGEVLPENVKQSIIFVSDKIKESHLDNTLIVVLNPQLEFYKLMSHYYPKKNYGISKTAILSLQSEISDFVEIGDFCKIGNAQIGKNSQLGNNVIVHDNVSIGCNVIISDNTVIGAQGVAWIWDTLTGERIIQPQIGGVDIQDRVFIGSNVTVVRGSVNENTMIGRDSLVSHGTQIGHGVQISHSTHIANNCTLAGNVVIGYESFIGAGVTISSQLKVAPKTTIGAGSTISKNIEIEGATYISMPARAIPRQDKLNGVPKRK